jgi:hypothetical protein
MLIVHQQANLFQRELSKILLTNTQIARKSTLKVARHNIEEAVATEIRKIVTKEISSRILNHRTEVVKIRSVAMKVWRDKEDRLETRNKTLTVMRVNSKHMKTPKIKIKTNCKRTKANLESQDI